MTVAGLVPMRQMPGVVRRLRDGETGLPDHARLPAAQGELALVKSRDFH